METMSNLEKINGLSNIGRLKIILNQYIKEIKYLKLYIMSLMVFLLFCYFVIIFFDQETVTKLGDEDQLFEWLTCIFFAAASAFFCLTFFKTRNLFFLILAIVFLFGAGEEISWGQRLLGFKTPESLNEINVQKEFNLHNIEIFNNKDLQGHVKYGLKKLLDMNFLFKLFVVLFGIFLPLCVYHIKFISRITMKLKVPIPPISIGLFIFLSWVMYQFVSTFILRDCSNQCFASVVEIFECTLSFIMLIISLYFFKERKILTTGKDIKQII